MAEGVAPAVPFGEGGGGGKSWGCQHADGWSHLASLVFAPWLAACAASACILVLCRAPRGATATAFRPGPPAVSAPPPAEPHARPRVFRYVSEGSPPPHAPFFLPPPPSPPPSLSPLTVHMTSPPCRRAQAAGHRRPPPPPPPPTGGRPPCTPNNACRSMGQWRRRRPPVTPPSPPPHASHYRVASPRKSAALDALIAMKAGDGLGGGRPRQVDAPASSTHSSYQ